MTNAELKELIHLLMMCGIMDKTALESGNITDEDWLRMESLIDKYQTDKTEPEVRGDLISRSALLKAMEEERQYLLARGLTGAEHILVHHCLPLIDNAPTVEAFTLLQVKELFDFNIKLIDEVENLKKESLQGEWIPVIERLPEKDGIYLVTLECVEDSEIVYEIDMAKFVYSEKDDCNNGFHKAYPVNAWQSLPEPYQKGGAEE